MKKYAPSVLARIEMPNVEAEHEWQAKALCEREVVELLSHKGDTLTGNQTTIVNIKVTVVKEKKPTN